MEKTVHALSQGLPVCGFSIDVPEDWPEGHLWTQVQDVSNISCLACKAEAEKLRSQNSKKPRL